MGALSRRSYAGPGPQGAARGGCPATARRDEVARRGCVRIGQGGWGSPFAHYTGGGNRGSSGTSGVEATLKGHRKTTSGSDLAGRSAVVLRGGLGALAICPWTTPAAATRVATIWRAGGATGVSDAPELSAAVLHRCMADLCAVWRCVASLALRCGTIDRETSQFHRLHFLSRFFAGPTADDGVVRVSVGGVGGNSEFLVQEMGHT